MRIALPLANGKFSIHYGRAEALSIHEIDLEKGISTSLGMRMFPQEGTCGAGKWVAAQGVEVLLAGGLGAGAAKGLGEAGVRVFAGVEEEEPNKVLEMFLAGIAQAKELAPGESACQGHGDEPGHQHGEGHVCTCKH